MKQSRFTHIEVGKEFIDHLILTRGSGDDVIKAVEFTPLIAGLNIDIWNEIFDKSENITRLRYLQPYLPIGVTISNLVSNSSKEIPSGGQDQSGFKLSQDEYEAVLKKFITHDPEGLKIIKEWSLAVTCKRSKNQV